MIFEVRYDNEEDLIYAWGKGEVDFESVEEFAAEVRRVFKQSNCRRLINDLRGVTSKLSVSDIYGVPEMLFEKGEPRIKRAMIVSSEMEQFHFFETVALNRGQIVKIFTDYEAAKEWVLSE